MDSRDNERNDLQEIIDKTLEDMRRDVGGTLRPDDVNLAEFARRSGLTRSKARTLKAKGFRATKHGRCGMRAAATVMTGHAKVADELLRGGVTNSSVIFDRLRDDGYEGGLTTVKDYVRSHMHLVPAKRKAVVPQGGRGERYETGPGEAFQMDWGFARVVDPLGQEWRIACFAMVCHHCGTCYVEFFPNARQENLFIGMVHAFMALGIPKRVLTDNMRSVVIRRDGDGRPVWQSDYAAFMACVGFRTSLCKPRHPFTKGKVERLVRFVKSNFLAGREFADITELNAEALSWCADQGSRYRRALGLVPADEHGTECLPATRPLEVTDEVACYLCLRRRVSFDGFVSYEGRRFGVPYWYSGRDCRVSREGAYLHVYSDDLSRELAAHPVTWGSKDSFCEDQYVESQPYELPTAPVEVTVAQLEPLPAKPAFSKFDFEGRL
jgi:transposase